MNKNDCENTIRKFLSKIGFDDYLESSCRSYLDPAINISYFLELAIFAHFGSDLIKSSLNHTSIPSADCIIDTLSRLHFIRIVKYIHDSSFDLALCDLTPLGKDFIEHCTNLPHATNLAYEQYHHQIAQNDYYLDNRKAYLGNPYNRLCNFICSDAFDNIVQPNQSLIRRNNLLDFIQRHLDYYQNLFSDQLALRSLSLALNKSMFYNL